jgi:hypothetical protein
MTAKVVNLNHARKERARVRARAAAEANAAKHGRTKADRTLDEARARQDALRLDGHRRGIDEDDGA